MGKRLNKAIAVIAVDLHKYDFYAHCRVMSNYSSKREDSDSRILEEYEKIVEPTNNK